MSGSGRRLRFYMESKCNRNGGPTPCVFRIPILLAGNWNRNIMKFNFLNAQSIAVAKTGRIRTRRVMILALAVGLAVLSTASMNIKTAHAGTPVPPPPLPPVRFALTIAPASVSVPIIDMNDYGELVGYYGHQGGDSTVVTCIVTGNQIKTLDEIVPLDGIAGPAGWRYGWVSKINNAGSIVGIMYKKSDIIVGAGFLSTTPRTVFVIHRPIGGMAKLIQIPFLETSKPMAKGINEHGMLLVETQYSTTSTQGMYVFDTSGTPTPFQLPIATNSISSGAGINNAFQVYGMRSDGKPFIYNTLYGNLELPNVEKIYAMNDMGAFCGPVTQRKGVIAYRYSSGVYQTFPDAKGPATKINEHGDMIFASSMGSEVQLYYQGGATLGSGTLNLGSLVVGNATEVSLFRNSNLWVRGLTERGSLNPFMPGFPGLGGCISGPNGQVPFTLTPVAP